MEHSVSCWAWSMLTIGGWEPLFTEVGSVGRRHTGEGNLTSSVLEDTFILQPSHSKSTHVIPGKHQAPRVLTMILFAIEKGNKSGSPEVCDSSVTKIIMAASTPRSSQYRCHRMPVQGPVWVSPQAGKASQRALGVACLYKGQRTYCLEVKTRKVKGTG